MYGFPKRKNPANGGLITGPGTGTSDSIEKEVPEGTYILPADTTKKLGYGAPGYKDNPKGMQKPEPRLGWPVKNKQVPVAVSNGELEMPPEQVHAVGAAVLDQVKDATHKPRGFGMSKQMRAEYKARQKEPRQFFMDGGLVEDEKRKPGFGMNNPARQGLTPQGVQSMAKDAASKPASGYGAPGYKGGVAASQTNPAAPDSELNLRDVPAGLGRAAVGALSIAQAAGADGLRNVAAYAVGGDPATLEGGSSKYRDMATGQVKQGLAQAGGAIERAQAAGREALGVQPLKAGQGAAPGESASPAAPAAPAATPAAATPARGYGWNKTGIGADRQGGEIVARMGENGVPEFTNEAATPGSVTTAGERPARGYGWRPKSERGGGGTFSQGEPGDAQMALERFERANQEREKMVQASRRGAIGEGGGRVTVVRDSSRAPDLNQVLVDRQEARVAQTEALRAQTQQGAASAANQLAMGAQRMGTEQLNQQRLQQQIAEGDLGMQDRQRLEQLRAQIADPNLSEEQRAHALQTYNSLAITPDARVKAQQEATGQRQSLIAEMYKAYRLSPPIGPDNKPVPFESWMRSTLQSLDSPQQQGGRLPEGVTAQYAIERARAAIASGVSREAVNNKLAQWGLDPI